jgi:hypothetical protein
MVSVSSSSTPILVLGAVLLLASVVVLSIASSASSSGGTRRLHSHASPRILDPKSIVSKPNPNSVDDNNNDDNDNNNDDDNHNDENDDNHNDDNDNNNDDDDDEYVFVEHDENEDSNNYNDNNDDINNDHDSNSDYGDVDSDSDNDNDCDSISGCITDSNNSDKNGIEKKTFFQQDFFGDAGFFDQIFDFSIVCERRAGAVDNGLRTLRHARGDGYTHVCLAAGLVQTPTSPEWIFDTGCTHSLLGDQSLFVSCYDITPTPNMKVMMNSFPTPCVATALFPWTVLLTDGSYTARG